MSSEGTISSPVAPVLAIRSRSAAGSVVTSFEAMTSAPPNGTERMRSAKKRSTERLETDRKRGFSSVRPYRSSQAVRMWRTLRCSTATPLGLPVEPEV